MPAKLRKCKKCEEFIYSVKCYKCSTLVDKTIITCEHCERKSIAKQKHLGKNVKCPYCKKDNAIFPEIAAFEWEIMCPYCFKRENMFCFSSEGGKQNDYTYISNSKQICLHCYGISNLYKMRSFQDDHKSISPMYSPLQVKKMMFSEKKFIDTRDLEDSLKEMNKHKDFIAQLKKYTSEENILRKPLQN